MGTSQYPKESTLIALRHVHVPYSNSEDDINNFLPLIKGERLRCLTSYTDDRTWVTTSCGRRGIVYNEHVSLADIYIDEDYFVTDFTAKMAERALQDKPAGSYMIRPNSSDHNKVVISATFEHIKHYRFQKKGGGLEYMDKTYNSLLSFVNLCANSQILDGLLTNCIKRSNLNIPQKVNLDYAVNQRFMSFRVIAGSLAVGVEDFQGITPFCVTIVKGRQYTILRAAGDPQWLIARDEVTQMEGYAPGCYLECFIPPWFHGRIDREKATHLLNKCNRDGTFLVKERLNNPGCYALSVWNPDFSITHVPLSYHKGKVTTGVSENLPKFECILFMVKYYCSQTRFWTMDGQCVRMLFPLSRKETSVPDEIRTLDMKSIEMYFKALKEGKEHVRDIRLMVIGHHGAGKTTLTERLMGKPFKNVGSTKGIEVHLRQCEYNLQSGEWLRARPGSTVMDDNTHSLRLMRALESPSEERTSFIEEMRHDSKANLSLTSSSTSRDESTNSLSPQQYEMAQEFPDTGCNQSQQEAMKFALNANEDNLVSDSVNIKDLKLTINNNDAKSIDNVCSTLSLKDYETPGNDWQKSEYSITNDDIPRYKFSISTIRAIETAFGRKRPQSGKDSRTGFISMWDFAGQFFFYATHQVFLTMRAVYLLVFDLSKSLDEFVVDTDFPLQSSESQGKTVKDYADFWLCSIHTFCGNVQGHPPVILVGTHLNDVVCRAGQTRTQFAEEYFEKFRKLLENSPIADHLQPEQFAVDGTQTDDCFEGLRKAIVTVAKRQKHWNQEIPSSWLPLERELSKLGAKEKFISIERLADINKEMEVPITDMEEVTLFLRYHNAVGSLIYLDEIPNTVVLDNQWIINAFRCLVMARQFCSLRPALRQMWSHLQETASLKDKLIDEIWGGEEGGVYLRDKDILLKYMEKLDIIARPKVKVDDGSKIDIDYYFVPCLLRIKGNKIVPSFPLCKEWECTPNLCFVFKEGFMPPMVFQRMLGACLSRYTIFRKGSEDQLYSDYGVFHLDSQHCFIFKLEDNAMKVKVVNLVESQVKAVLCDKLRRFLSSQLESELCRYRHNTSFTLHVECFRPDHTPSVLINCKELLKEGRLPCYAHEETHTVHANILLQSWYPDYMELPKGQGAHKSWIDSVPQVIRKREVTLKDLSKIAQSLGFNWEFVMIELGVSQATIDQCKMDHRDQVAMQIYHCLLRWKNSEGYKANIETLVKAIQANSTVEADWEAIKNVADMFTENGGTIMNARMLPSV
ncbi:uncharacterized protein LOC127881359 isoform X2 [Dreissena polymorpha]|uniref:non-specific serine/threonine protein kinase n=2 Tax=Dreissena polymorpha TaxID=45954 RepID=A0A9D4H7S5_DREPO|nr:uncharacterized protein LOC127881359 isoform X2 [Dreissena polymorpha]KAH3826832.1 hypothetical protein DPMN_128744 [Dreissena polymorpha]